MGWHGLLRMPIATTKSKPVARPAGAWGCSAIHSFGRPCLALLTGAAAGLVTVCRPGADRLRLSINRYPPSGPDLQLVTQTQSVMISLSESVMISCSESTFTARVETRESLTSLVQARSGLLPQTRNEPVGSGIFYIPPQGPPLIAKKLCFLLCRRRVCEVTSACTHRALTFFSSRSAFVFRSCS